MTVLGCSIFVSSAEILLLVWDEQSWRPTKKAERKEILRIDEKPRGRFSDLLKGKRELIIHSMWILLVSSGLYS